MSRGLRPYRTLRSTPAISPATMIASRVRNGPAQLDALRKCVSRVRLIIPREARSNGNIGDRSILDYTPENVVDKLYG